MWSVFVRIQTVCAGYFYPTGDEPKVTRDVGPNITGDVSAPRGTSAIGPTNGALYTDANRSSYDPGYAASNAAYPRLYLDASRLSSIYGTSEVVQPSAIYTLACIKF